MKDNTGMDTMDTSAKSGNKTRDVKVVSVRRRPVENPVELWHSVYVVGPENGPGFAQMFVGAKCHKAKTLQDADIVVFTGGSLDIHPEMYGVSPEDTHDTVWFESQECADLMIKYIETYQECLFTGKAMIGVCLGAQFLHVMNGGTLYQDIDSHNSDHPIYCATTGKTFYETPSVHHQACKLNEKMVILATAAESNERWLNRTNCELVVDDPTKEDIEAFFYPGTMCLGIQGHPEYQGYPDYTQWFLNQILDRIINSPKMHLEKSVLTMKQEYLKKQDTSLPKTVQEFIKEYS